MHSLTGLACPSQRVPREHCQLGRCRMGRKCRWLGEPRFPGLWVRTFSYKCKKQKDHSRAKILLPTEHNVWFILS